MGASSLAIDSHDRDAANEERGTTMYPYVVFDHKNQMQEESILVDICSSSEFITSARIST